jgi:ATP-dependent DNA helicase RecG
VTVRAEAKLLPETPVQYVRGVGAARAAILADAGFETVRDLLLDFPFRYEDRRHPVRIIDLRRIDEPVTLRGRVVSAAKRTSPVKRMKIFEAILDDGSGTIMLVWFNQPYLSDQIRRGDHLAIYGQPRLSNAGRLQIESPDWEKTDAEDAEGEGKIVPVYSSVSTITPKGMRRIVQQALDAIDGLADPLPEEIRSRLEVMPLRDAVRQLHAPSELTPEFLECRSPAHRRIILEEFFSFQLALQLRRASDEVEIKERKIEIDDRIRGRVREVLPFSLTGAQKRVLKEIAEDMQGGRPMYRLLQGDVGSGKTIVALIAAIVAIENGHQVALLAPTEILSEQHYQRIRQLVDGMVRIAKLTGSTTAAERRPILAGLREGYVQLVIGTHALLEDPVRFQSLGLAIVDEQHRFGVEQRQRLFAKANAPDILVMTATPIPRSLALALYGDLDLSVIDELPPGRQPVKTVVRATTQLPKVYDFVDGQIAAGAQIYIVYPIIEESEKLDLKPLTAGYESVRQRFPDRAVAMLHGRLSAREKEETMEAFQQRKVDILVSTTVIEVGVDVANASIMLVMDAERFGLSQLHQLRGRVGRGGRRSYCILLRDESTAEEAKERLRTFESTRDGFDVAEKDLQYRGFGDILGTRQSGLPRFRFGDIVRDHRLMEQARDTAVEILREHGYDATLALAQQVIPGLARAARKD